MKLSIIIPTFKTREITLECIERIYLHPPKETYEILVVDNHSQDGTCEAVRAKYAQVITIQNQKNLGFSKACNIGAARAQGDYLLFLNSDTLAGSETFDRLSDWLDTHPQTGIVGPELLGSKGEIIQMSWVWHPLLIGELIQQYFAPYAIRRSAIRQRLIRFLQRKSKSVPSMCGACLMIRKPLFQSIGGFDEDFELYFEDSDLCLRCHNGDWRIDFVAEAKIIHRLGQSTRGSWTTTSLIYQQSHIAFYRKHSNVLLIFLLKLYLLMKWVRLWLVARFSEPSAEAQAYCRAYLDIILERRHLTLEEGIPA